MRRGAGAERQRRREIGFLAVVLNESGAAVIWSRAKAPGNVRERTRKTVIRSGAVK